MRILFEDNNLKVAHCTETTSDSKGPTTTLLSFTGVGHAMGGIDVQKAEFFGAGRGLDNVLFITDKTRSWGNRIDFNELAYVIAPFCNGAMTYAIGNSMGGFLAIVMSSYVRINCVVAFVPQFSVCPQIVPWETRWTEYRSQIIDYHVQDVGASFVSGTRYILFSGGRGLDRRQALQFPVRDNIHHFIFPKIEHSVAIDLKEINILDRVIRASFAGTLNMLALSESSGIEFEQFSPAPA
ncbi:MAG: hypothetical protein KGZ72_02470 [Roseovarius sp.]|jgi:hypothetical protein|nr:hypothetical protein [Roseovarius sp.]